MTAIGQYTNHDWNIGKNSVKKRANMFVEVMKVRKSWGCISVANRSLQNIS